MKKFKIFLSHNKEDVKKLFLYELSARGKFVRWYNIWPIIIITEGLALLKVIKHMPFDPFQIVLSIGIFIGYPFLLWKFYRVWKKSEH